MIFLRNGSIVEHVSQNMSKICLLFLKVPNTSIITVQVSGTRLNHGSDYGLEISVVYRKGKLINWIVKKIEAIKSELDCKVSKFLK